MGPAGCNMCAGTLGSNLLRLLEDTGYKLPSNVIRHEVTGYTFHFREKNIQLWQETQEKIFTVYRGMGPYPKYQDKISFDQYLLDEAKAKGANYVSESIEEIEKVEADLVVGAFGVNSNLSKKLSFGYIPPKSWQACQAEIPASEEFTKINLKNNIHIFNIADPNIHFVALVPKGNFISVSVIGPYVKITDMENVLQLPEFRDYLPRNWIVRCHCHPKIPITSAKHPYHDRIIMIGDACNSRYLKNGIESAFLTAKLAAEVVLTKGISKKILHKEYYKECNKLFNFDNHCGKLLFEINHIISRKPSLASRFIDFTIKEKTGNSTFPITPQILWNMFTGSVPYKDILLKAINPKLLFNLGPFLLSHNKDKPILPAYRIAIVGGGPGGSSCAIKLLDLAKKLNKDIKVIIYEGKDFERHYNQCVGVLSPPLEEIMDKELGITLPEELIKRTIYGYKLHGDNNELLLSETGKYHTYTVRRVKFDEFLLNYAKLKGAEIIPSRVTNIEFIKQSDLGEVRIYSESGYQRVDVAVIASGVDSTMLHELENATRETSGFHSPTEYLKTIITKIHTDPDFITNTIGNYVHAFILSNLPNIEFGAITPKGDHIIINIAGKNITSLDMDTFLHQPQVKKLLPRINFNELEYFKGKFPIIRAQNPYGDRFVAVGDVTGWLRPFKGKGINTAVITGIKAAETILYRGITKEAFAYYERDCKNLTEAYRFGVLARFILKFTKTAKRFDSIIELAKMDLALYDILYQCISGEKLYKEIFNKFLNAKLLWRLFIFLVFRKR